MNGAEAPVRAGPSRVRCRAEAGSLYRGGCVVEGVQDQILQVLERVFVSRHSEAGCLAASGLGVDKRPELGPRGGTRAGYRVIRW